MRTIIIMFILLMTVSSCSNNKDIEALAIYQQAQVLDKQGRELEALAVYDKLADYKGTLPYERAAKDLEARGYSLGVSLTSWTVHKMVKMENQIVRYINTNKRFPNISQFQALKDAWGRNFDVIYNPTPRIVFLIFSPGGDSLSDEDDLRIAYMKEFNFNIAEARPGAGDNASKGMDSQQSGSETPETKSSLEDLKDPDKKKNPSEKSMDLNELLKKKKPTN